MPVLNGVTRNGAGNPLAGVSIKVFRSDNDALVASGTSGSDGTYSIVTPGTGPYYAVAYKAGSPDIAGTTVNTLTASIVYASGAAVSAGASVASAQAGAFAPVLAWSGTTTDATPDLTITFTSPQVSDVATVQLDTDSGFGSASSTTDTLDAGEVAANEVDLSLSTLADGVYYARAKVTRLGVDSAWSNTVTITIATDTTPTAFTFTDVTGATLSTVYTSNTITVAGINTASPISITGGTYSKNGGSYTSSSGTVVNGDTVAVRVTSSASGSTAVNAVLTIGGVSDTYTVTTTAAVATTTFSTTPQATTGSPVFSNGNLTFTTDAAGGTAKSAMAIPAGSYYFEIHADAFSGGNFAVGVGIGVGTDQIGWDGQKSLAIFNNTSAWKNGGALSFGEPSFVVGDTVGVKVVHNGSTGTAQLVGPTGTLGTAFAIDTVLAAGSGVIYAITGSFNTATFAATANFGATTYAHGLPSGFSSIPG